MVFAMESPYLTTNEVATRLRVDVQTVRRWCHEGTLEAVRVGKSLRVDRAALAAFERPAAQPPP